MPRSRAARCGSGCSSSVIEVVRGDAQRAAQQTGDQSFQRAAENLSEAISLTESRSDQAGSKTGRDGGLADPVGRERGARTLARGIHQ